jgi:hypothetical protein
MGPIGIIPVAATNESPNLNVLKPFVGFPTNRLSANNATCTMCDVVVTWITFEIKEANATINTLEQIVKMLCTVLSKPPIRTQCLGLLKDLDAIKNWILQGLSPGQICQKLFNCPPGSVDCYSIIYCDVDTCHTVI